MASDPGFANDSCIFMEAVPGDGGAHNANGIWWLSPDITLTGPVSGIDHADAGQVNAAQVKFHRKAANSNCQFPGDESLTVQLWVANPSLVMAPNNPQSAALVGFIGSPVPVEGGSGVQPIEFTPQAAAPNNPQNPGSKCLVARCYPESLTPDSNSFFAPDDQHVAQHNICVVACRPSGLTLPPSQSGICKLQVTTLNPGPNSTLTLRAVLDQHPTDFVRKVVQQRAHAPHAVPIPGTHLPRGFGIDASPLPAQLVDHSHPAPSQPHTIPSFDATVKLRAGQLIKFMFFADLTGIAAGSGYIFHLTQIDAANHVQGGLTVVMVTV